MNDVIIRRLVKRRLDLDDHLPHHARQLVHFVLLDVLEVAGVVFRQNPRLEREPAANGQNAMKSGVSNTMRSSLSISCSIMSQYMHLPR